jgi:hypothetical protein
MPFQPVERKQFGRFLSFVFLAVAGASVTVAAAKAFVPGVIVNDFASSRRKIASQAAKKDHSFGRYPAQVNLPKERASAERQDGAKQAGVDDDVSGTGVFLFHQANQLPGGAAVQVPFGKDVQVAVSSFKSHSEVCTHERFPFLVVRHVGSVPSMANRDEHRSCRLVKKKAHPDVCRNRVAPSLAPVPLRRGTRKMFQ